MAAIGKVIVLILACVCATEIKLATFDGAKETTAKWRDLNDPVMGGASTSSFKVSSDKTGVFNGTCAIVGFLKAPGFAKIVGSAKFSDVTGYDSIALSKVFDARLSRLQSCLCCSRNPEDFHVRWIFIQSQLPIEWW